MHVAEIRFAKLNEVKINHANRIFGKDLHTG